MQTQYRQELEMEEEGIRKRWVEALLDLSPFFCSLCLLPMEYLGKFKIYKLTAVFRTPKESLHLQNNLFKHSSSLCCNSSEREGYLVTGYSLELINVGQILGRSTNPVLH